MFVQMQALGEVLRDPEVQTMGGIPYAQFPLANRTTRCVRPVLRSS